jgi:hypothetical protein
VLDELGREPRVVDEPDLLEPVELGGDLVAVEPGPDEPGPELAPGPRPDGQERQRALVQGEPAHAGQPAAAGSAARSLLAFFADGDS